MSPYGRVQSGGAPPPCREEGCAREKLGVLLPVCEAHQFALMLVGVCVVDVGVGSWACEGHSCSLAFGCLVCLCCQFDGCER